MASISTGNYCGNTYAVKYEFRAAGDDKFTSATLTISADDTEIAIIEVYRILGVVNWAMPDPEDRISFSGSLPEYDACISAIVPALATHVTVSEIVRKGAENTNAVVATRVVIESPGVPKIEEQPVYTVATHTVDLTWAASSMGDPASYYIIYRALQTADGPGSTGDELANYIQVGTTYGLAFTDSDFDSAGYYYYRVQAANTGGTSAMSGQTDAVQVYDTSLIWVNALGAVKDITTFVQDKAYVIIDGLIPAAEKLDVGEFAFTGAAPVGMFYPAISDVVALDDVAVAKIPVLDGYRGKTIYQVGFTAPDIVSDKAAFKAVGSFKAGLAITKSGWTFSPSARRFDYQGRGLLDASVVLSGSSAVFTFSGINPNYVDNLQAELQDDTGGTDAGFDQFVITNGVGTLAWDKTQEFPAFEVSNNFYTLSIPVGGAKSAGAVTISLCGNSFYVFKAPLELIVT